MESMASMAAHNNSLSHFPDPADRQNDANTIGSVGSRVPFSWAEITKIQPKFHNELDNFSKPKVFDQSHQTLKIATRHQPKGSGHGKKQTKSNVSKVNNIVDKQEDILMPSIPETDPFANKSDLGRRVRKAGKRGSRLKYPNGKKGG